MPAELPHLSYPSKPRQTQLRRNSGATVGYILGTTVHFGQAAIDGAIACAEKMDNSASGSHEEGACEVRLTSNTRVDLGGIVGGAPAVPYAMAGGHCTGTALLSTCLASQDQQHSPHPVIAKAGNDELALISVLGLRYSALYRRSRVLPLEKPGWAHIQHWEERPLHVAGVRRTVIFRLSPTRMPSTPLSHPLITSPTPVPPHAPKYLIPRMARPWTSRV